MNLENLESRPFFAKSQGKPGIVREFCIIFTQVRERPRKVNYLVSISFLSTIGRVVHKVIALIVISKCELYALLCEIASIMHISYLLCSIFFTSFCKYVKWGSGKKWVVLTTSQGKRKGIVREF